MSKNKNDDLDFELDFLDQNSKEFASDKKRVEKIAADQEHEARKAAKAANKKAPQTNGVIGAVVFGLIIWGIFAINGNSCTPQDPSVVASMQPSQSEKSYLDAETSRLSTVSSQLDAQKVQIDSSTINAYSPQYMIDIYNIMVASYNNKLRQYQTDVASYNVRENTFNNKVDSYNSYINSHCTS